MRLDFDSATSESLRCVGAFTTVVSHSIVPTAAAWPPRSLGSNSEVASTTGAVAGTTAALACRACVRLAPNIDSVRHTGHSSSGCSDQTPRSCSRRPSRSLRSGDRTRSDRLAISLPLRPSWSWQTQ